MHNNVPLCSLDPIRESKSLLLFLKSSLVVKATVTFQKYHGAINKARSMAKNAL